MHMFISLINHSITSSTFADRHSYPRKSMQNLKTISPTTGTKTSHVSCPSIASTDISAMTHDALLLDRDAANRALDFYLSDTPPLAKMTSAIIASHDGVKLKATLAHASQVLRQAGGTLHGLPNEELISVMHLIEVAQSCVDTSLDRLIRR